MVTMRRLPVDVEDITKHVSGKSVSHVTQPDARRLDIHFTDHSILAVELLQHRLVAALTRRSGDAMGKGFNHGPQPTRRQREYLAFITRYIARFGVSPAESDIQRHFLLSAPSVTHMVQTLERRGFITRQRGVPRSFRVVDHTDQVGCVDTHTTARAEALRPNGALQRIRRRPSGPPRR